MLPALTLVGLAGCFFDASGLAPGSELSDGATPPIDLPANSQDGVSPPPPTDSKPPPPNDGKPPPDKGAPPPPDKGLPPPPDKGLPPPPDKGPPPPPDKGPPDVNPDTGPPVYVNETFSSGMGKLAPKKGSWLTGGGKVEQSSSFENGNYATVPVPVSDYTVESVVTVHKIQGLSGAWEGAGIAARIQPPKSSGNPVPQYACVVLTDGNVLSLVEADGTSKLYSNKGTKSVQITLNTPYRLRLRVKGSNITCSLPDHGVAITAVDSSHSNGPAGLTTLYANATWDYLLVTGP